MAGGSSSNDLSYNIDPKSALAAIRQIQDAHKAMAKSGVAAGEELDASLVATENLYKNLITITDRQLQAQNRLAKSYALQADQAGKSAEDRIIARRDAVIRQLGQNQKAIDLVTASTKKLIEAERQQQQQGSGHGGSGITRFGIFAAKDLAEGRTTNAAAEGVNILTRLGGASLIIGGITAGFVGLAAAGASAVRSLADYGTEFKDLQLQTGLTARETAQFSFAAKAVGQDVSIVARLMRGLTEATEDLSPAGQKGRKTLQDLGVSVTDLNGKVRPTAQLLQEISEKFSHLNPGTKLAQDARDLFQRAGVEAIPFLKELQANTVYFDAHGLPAPKQDDIDKWASYKQQIADVDARWEQFKNSFKDITATVFLKVVQAGSAITAGETPLDIGQASKEDLLARSRGDFSNVVPFTDIRGDAARGLFNRGILQTRRNADLIFGTQGSDEAKRFLSNFGSGTREGAERELSVRKQDLDEKRVLLERSAANGTLLSVVQEQEKAVNKANAAYQRQEELVKRLGKEEQERLNYLQNVAHLRDQVADNDTRTKYQNLGEAGKIRGEEDIALRNLLRENTNNGVLAQPGGRAVFQKLYGQEAAGFALRIAEVNRKDAEDKQIQRELLNNYQAEGTGERRARGPIGAAEKLFFEENQKRFRAQDEILDINLGGAKSETERRFGRAGQISSLSNSGNPVAQATNAYQIRLQLAQQLDQIEQRRINLLDEGNERDIANARRLNTLALERNQAQDEYDIKRLEIVKQQTEEIKGQVNTLVTTLFTKPGNFGKDLLGTVKTAALKPITEGISEHISTFLQPVIFGAGGNGGINGALRGISGGSTGIGAPLIPAASALTYAASALTNAAGAIAGGGGGGGGFSGGGGGFSPFPVGPGGSLGGTSGFSGGSGDFGASPLGLPSFLGPGGTPGFVNSGSGGLNSGFGGFSGGGSTSGGGGGGGIGGILGGIFRGGGGGGGTQGGGGFGGFIKGIGSLFNKSSYSGFHIGDLFGRGDKGGTPGIDDNTPGVDEGQGFSIGSLSKAPLANTPFGGIAGGIGIALAEHGLLGNQRGTFAGTLQGAAGGYLIAGPIGAAVGAGIGFGEQIAGVESPRNEAKRLVKSQYGITINTAMADQIVAISQQSYASHVSLAVRSPEVRQMLGLYAAGTGQSRNFPQGADTPHGGGLVESGGRLFQQTTSLYGNQYAYSSNLPVYGGTAGVGTFPSPGGGGGNISLSLNVDGDGISPFMQGQVITPSYVAQAQAAAWRGSQGRVDAALALSQPGSIAS